MSILYICTIGDKKLRQKSTPIPEIDGNLKNLAEDLLDSMYAGNGVGLAASQVGILKRIFVIDIEDLTDGPIVFINPVITRYSRDMIPFEEGCLSIPEFNFKIKRHNSIIIEYTDLNKNKQVISAEGILSIVIQHEYDHLNGILFIDRVPEREFKKALKVLAQEGFVYDLEQRPDLTSSDYN